ncbi:MAG: glycoside hydrolase family 20 zincin-like fold domain-containing protein [Bacteroidota bacterium]
MTPLLMLKGPLALLLLVLVPRGGSAQPLPVVPAPQSMTWGDGPAVERPSALRLAAADTAGLSTALAQAQTVLGAGEAGTLWLGLPEDDAGLATALAKRQLWPDARIGEEGYVLAIDAEGIYLGANTPAGVFYGVQTLKQLGRAYGAKLPALRMADWPTLRLRGVMDDISRGPIPTLAYMKHQVRRFAEMKLNTLTYYTEHVVATEAHGAFAPADGGISVAEWRELAAYARAHHVTLVGNFQSFGHFDQILAHPAYEHLGESGRLLSPVLPESEALLRDLYDELVPAFDAPFFHVNSDETWDIGRGYSKARVDSLGVGIVYAEHVEHMHALLAERGVQMWMWADIALQHPEILERLPKDIIMLTWDYSPQASFAPWIEPVQKAGFEVVVCPGVLNSNRVMPRLDQAVANIRGFVAEGAARQALGMLNTVWDDGGTALFGVDWYGIATGADAAWHPAPAHEATFDDRATRALYADPGGHLVRALHTLDAIAALEPTDGHTDRALWQQLLPARGAQQTLSPVGWPDVAALADSAQSLLAQAPPAPDQAEAAAVHFVADLYGTLARTRLDLLDAAEAYRGAVLDQPTDRAAARAQLRQALTLLQGLEQAWLAITHRYTDRWYAENRTYALDRVTDRLTATQHDFAAVRDRLQRALRDHDLGHALPVPAEVRLALTADAGRYFREWLVAGPFPNPAGSDGAETDYLATMGGETVAQPGVAVEFDHDGVTYRWQRLASPQHAEVDLAAHFPEQNRRVALYAYATLDAPADQTVRALVGSNDGIEVFINGTRVHRHHVKRNLTVDEDEVRLPLQAGRNHLLLKISQGAGGWGFAFRLPDHDMRSRKNRYRILP